MVFAWGRDAGRTNQSRNQTGGARAVTALRDWTGPEAAEVVIATTVLFDWHRTTTSAAAITEVVAYIRLIIEGQFGKT